MWLYYFKKYTTYVSPSWATLNILSLVVFVSVTWFFFNFFLSYYIMIICDSLKGKDLKVSSLDENLIISTGVNHGWDQVTHLIRIRYWQSLAYGVGKLVSPPKTVQTVFITWGFLVLAASSFFLKRGPSWETGFLQVRNGERTKCWKLSRMFRTVCDSSQSCSLHF